MATEGSYTVNMLYESSLLNKKKSQDIVIFSNLQPMPSENIVVKIMGAEPKTRDRKSIIEYLKEDLSVKTEVIPLEKPKAYRTVADVVAEKLRKVAPTKEGESEAEKLTNAASIEASVTYDYLSKQSVSKTLEKADLIKSQIEEDDTPEEPSKVKYTVTYDEKATSESRSKRTMLTEEKAQGNVSKEQLPPEESEIKSISYEKLPASKRKRKIAPPKLSAPEHPSEISSYHLLPIPTHLRLRSKDTPRKFISFDQLETSDYGVVHRTPILKVIKEKIKILYQKFQKRFMKQEEEEEEEEDVESVFLEEEYNEDEESPDGSDDKKRRHVAFDEDVVYTTEQGFFGAEKDDNAPTIEKSKSIIKTDISESSSDFSALPPPLDPEFSKPLFSFALNIPKHIFNDDKFKWLFKDDPKKEIQRETQDIGGFRAYDSGDTSSSNAKGNISDSEWVQELYTSDELTAFDDKYYYFLEFKDYEAKAREHDIKSEKLKAELLAKKNVKPDRHYGKNVTKLLKYWKQYQMKKQKFQEYFKEPIETNKAFMTRGLDDCNLKPALGNLNMKEKIIQWERRHFQQKVHPRRYQGVMPEDISTNLLAVFREDMLSMSRDRCFKVWKTPEQGKQITLSSPQHFLKSLRFDSEIADELGIKTDDLFERVQIALKWARTMTSSLARPRAELVIFLTVCTVPETMRWFTRLVEAVVNRRINSKSVILGYLNVLYDIEIEYLPIDVIFPYPQHPKVSFDDYLLLKKMKRRIFSSFYRAAKQKYSEDGIETVPPKALKFLYNMAMINYKSGLYKHMDYLVDILHKGIPKTPIEWAGAALKLVSQEEVTSIYEQEIKDFLTLKKEKDIHRFLVKKYYDQLDKDTDEIF